MSNQPLLSLFKLFRDLTNAQQFELRALMLSRAFHAGDLLVKQGTQSGVVFLLESGSVKVTRGPVEAKIGGKTPLSPITLSLLASGSVIGELHALDGEAHLYSVEAIEAVCALTLPAEDFLRFVQTIPKLNAAVIAHLVQMNRFQARRQEILALHNVGGAMAAQLLLLAEQCGEVQDDGSELVPLPLNQTLLASLIGHSRESVNRTLKLFSQAGYLEQRPHHRILLTNSPALKRIYYQAIPRR